MNKKVAIRGTNYIVKIKFGLTHYAGNQKFDIIPTNIVQTNFTYVSHVFYKDDAFDEFINLAKVSFFNLAHKKVSKNGIARDHPSLMKSLREKFVEEFLKHNWTFGCIHSPNTSVEVQNYIIVNYQKKKSGVLTKVFGTHNNELYQRELYTTENRYAAFSEKEGLMFISSDYNINT